METELAEAAKEFVDAPKRLHAKILQAAAKGDSANRITLAIGQVYSPDYVRALIREARKRGEIPPRGQKAATADS